MSDQLTRADVPEKNQRFGCAAPGCGHHPAVTECVIHRISPKGELFEGLCDEHYGVWLSSVEAREEW